MIVLQFLQQIITTISLCCSVSDKNINEMADVIEAEVDGHLYW